MYTIEVEVLGLSEGFDPRVGFASLEEVVGWLGRQHVPGGHRALRADVHRLLSPDEESLFADAPKDTRVAQLRWTREEGWRQI